MEALQAPSSVRPGAPMAMAEMATALWAGGAGLGPGAGHLRHNPANPHWPDRDRFVLGNGRASMLLYALLHLSGYALPMEELKRFRQLHSLTPGHPEVDTTPGVEATTGPLGQGLANAVGMALAEQRLAREFNRPGHSVVDHRTYVLLGAGCLTEGISHEVCSLAGGWRLNKLVALYDEKGIGIDGPVDGSFRDDTAARFRACGWHVIGPIDGHDVAAVSAALAQAGGSADKPTLIVCHTNIGLPHGPFELPDAVRALWDATEAGAAREAAWAARFEAYGAAYPAEAAELERRWSGELPAGLPAVAHAALAGFADKPEAVASGTASQKVLAALAPHIPEMLGGSADLTGSKLADFPGGAERHISYGLREFGMAAIMNGIALHGGFIPCGSTSLTFSDYSRNAIRMAALMKRRVIHVFTHDSVGLGEDGPAHQSVEQLPTLRLMPNLDVWRPADALETLVAWALALQRQDGPTALCLSRQVLPVVTTPALADAISRGGYVLSEAHSGTDDVPQAVIIGTGSELQLALKAQAMLAAEGVAVRVVSMPCTNVFDRQDLEWQDGVLPHGVPAVAVEAAQPDFWRKYVGREGGVVGLGSYGASTPAPVLFEYFDITAEAVVAEVMRVLKR